MVRYFSTADRDRMSQYLESAKEDGTIVNVSEMIRLVGVKEGWRDMVTDYVSKWLPATPEARHDAIEMFPVNMVTDHTIQANIESPDVSWMRDKLFEAQLKEAEALKEFESCHAEAWHWQELLKREEANQT